MNGVRVNEQHYQVIRFHLLNMLLNSSMIPQSCATDDAGVNLLRRMFSAGAFFSLWLESRRGRVAAGGDCRPQGGVPIVALPAGYQWSCPAVYA